LWAADVPLYPCHAIINTNVRAEFIMQVKMVLVDNFLLLYKLLTKNSDIKTIDKQIKLLIEFKISKNQNLVLVV
jgi:hypothetical protein